MTTTTFTEYAVQAEMLLGHWTFVMDETGKKILTYPSKIEADDARNIWNIDHSRVVSRQVRPIATPWRLA